MSNTPDHWKSIFLDAYKNNQGDARRLALNEAWFAFVSSEDYHNLLLTEIDGFAHGHYSYWTALVDAAHVERGPLISLGLMSEETRAKFTRMLEELNPA